MHKTYTILSDLPAPIALERISDLFSREAVPYVTVENSLKSTRTPVVISGFQPNLYSHANWVGLNPFAFVTAWI